MNIRIGLVVLTVGVIVGISFFLFSIRMGKIDFHNNIKLQTKHLSDTFSQQLWLFDLNTTQQLADLAVESSDIIGLRILDHNQKIVVESGTFSNDSAVKIAKDLLYQNKILVGHMEIIFGHPACIKSQKTAIGAGVFMLTMIILASFLLISSILNRHLVKPLDHLQRDMISLTTGAFKRSEMMGHKTEIQNIINVFNQMVSALIERELSQQEAESLLSKEKVFIEALIHTLPGLFYVYEEGKRLVRWNRNFQIVTGLSDDEMLNKSPEEWVAEKDRHAMTQMVKNTLANRDASIEIDLVFQTGPTPYLLTATNFTINEKNLCPGCRDKSCQKKTIGKQIAPGAKNGINRHVGRRYCP